MYSLTIRPELSVLQAYRNQFQKYPTLLHTQFDRLSRKERKALADDLYTEPDKLPDLPFIWSTDPIKQGRARRYYFGVILKGKKRPGGRYERTHRLVKSWKVVYNAKTYEGAITVSNDAPGFNFVIGDWQVPSHTATGWYHTETVLDEHRQHLTDVLIAAHQTVTDPFAGVS